MENVAYSKLNDIIANGRKIASAGMAALDQEYRLRQDYRVRPNVVDVEVREIGRTGEEDVREIRPVFDVPGTGRRSFALTGFSRGQFLARAGIPQGYADTLLKHDPDLLRHSVQRLLPRLSPDSLFVRTVGDTAKGVLSAAYRPIDAVAVFQSYVERSLANGYVPHLGEITDTRAFLSFIEQEPIEIFPGEWVILGTELRTSDYGNGKLDLSLAILRLLCKNGMTGFSMFSKIHLGRRFTGEDFGGHEILEISNKTIELDSATVQSALTDAMGSTRTAGRALVERLQKTAAPGEPFTVTGAIERLRKHGIRKEVLDEARALYENNALPVEAVPQEMGAWRMANVLSLLANSRHGDDAADMRDAAFRLLAA